MRKTIEAHTEGDPHQTLNSWAVHFSGLRDKTLKQNAIFLSSFSLDGQREINRCGMDSNCRYEDSVLVSYILALILYCIHMGTMEMQTLYIYLITRHSRLDPQWV